MTYYTELQCLRNGINVMQAQADNARRLTLHHFKHRHDGRTNRPARQWLETYRKTYRAADRARLAEIEAGAPQRVWREGYWVSTEELDA